MNDSNTQCTILHTDVPHNGNIDHYTSIFIDYDLISCQLVLNKIIDDNDWSDDQVKEEIEKGRIKLESFFVCNLPEKYKQYFEAEKNRDAARIKLDELTQLTQEMGLYND